MMTTNDDLDAVATSLGDRFFALFEQAAGHPIDPAMRDDGELKTLLVWARDHGGADFENDFLPHAVERIGLPIELDAEWTARFKTMYRETFEAGKKLLTEGRSDG